MNRFLMILLMTILIASLSEATTYYVGKSGSDGNSCATASGSSGQLTPGNRKLTLNAGAACLSSGDTLTVGDGTYNEFLENVLPAGLSASQPTTIKAENKRQVIMNKFAGSTTMIVMGRNAVCSSYIPCTCSDPGESRNYITIDGIFFDLPRDLSGGAISPWGECPAGSVHHLTFTNNEIKGGCNTGNLTQFTTAFGQGGNGAFFTVTDNYIHDIGTIACPGLDPDLIMHHAWSYGMYISGSDNVFDRNEITRTSGFAFHGYSTGNRLLRNVIRNNYIHDTGGNMLICGSNNQIYNNVLARTGIGPTGTGEAHGSNKGGIVMGPDGDCSGANANNNQVYHNTLVRTSNQGQGTGRAILMGGGTFTAQNNDVRNNILWQNTPDDTILNTSTTAGTNTTAPNFCNVAGCAISGDPQFVTFIPNSDLDQANITRESFKIQTNSLAKNAGVNVGIPTDMGGQARDSQPDMGAWEFGGSQVPPPISYTAIFCDSEQSPDVCPRAVDANNATIWHTKYSPTVDPLPHEIQVDINTNIRIAGFTYLPRQDTGTGGIVTQYEFYVSSSTSDWGSPVSTGSFAPDHTLKTVNFSVPVSGRYFRFRALADASNNGLTSVAELAVITLEGALSKSTFFLGGQ